MAHFSPSLISEIKAQASRAIIQIADDLLLHEYPHKARCAGGYEYGRKRGKRSWTVTETGPYAGWAKHWSGENLDAAGLVMERTGYSYPEALAWLASFLGIATDTAPLNPAKAQQARREREAKERAKQRRRKQDQERQNSAARQRALSFLSRCRPATGTPASRYLTEHRGLIEPEGGWPSCIRWHEQGSCLVAVLSNEAGEPLTGQRISLTRNTAARRKGADGKPEAKKLMPGPRGGLFMRLAALPVSSLPDTIRPPLILAEGPETALSLWQATRAETWATIGAGGKVPVPGSRLVILARDDDQPGSPADKRADDLKARLQGQGHIVVDCWPHAERRGDKSDFNDLLQANGQAAVLARVVEALRCAPQPLPPIGTAREKLKELIESFITSHIGKAVPEGGKTPSLLLPVGVGIGKSHAAQLAAIQNYDREKGPVVWAAPNQELAEQVAKDLQKLAPHLTIRVWKGREQPGMCQNTEDRKTVEQAGLSVMKTLCRKRGACPFAEGCPYLAQVTAQADFWVIPHNLLFMAKPETIPTPSLLIIDENFSSAGLKGCDGKGKGRAVASIRFPEKYRKTQKHFTAQHAENRADRFRAAMERLAERDGAYLSKSDLTALDFTADNLKEAREETSEAMRWLAKDGSDIETIREWASVLRFARSLCGLYAEAERLMRGEAEETGRLTVAHSPNGPTYKLTGISQIARGWTVPTLMLDATANPETVKAFFPDVEIAEAIQAEAPYAQFVHAPRLRWGKRAQANATKQHQQGERGLGGCSLEAIRVGMWDRLLETGGTSLTICNKATRHYLEGRQEDDTGTSAPMPPEEKPFLPPGASLAHFGNLVGLNAFEDISSLDIYGRPLPNVQELERKAETILGVPLQQKAERLEWIATSRTTRTGETVSSGRYRHPDPFADALLQEMLDGQLIQAAGRARAVNRGPDNPVIIRLHAETYPATLPLDHVEEQGGPSALAIQVAGDNGAMPALMSAGDAYTCQPDLWLTPEAAKKALQRKKPQFSAWSGEFVPKGTKPSNNISKGKCPFGYKLSTGPGKLPLLSFRPVSYRPAGSREKWRAALVPSDWSDSALRNWLESGLAVPIELQGDPPMPSEQLEQDAAPITVPASDPAPSCLQELVAIFDRAISDREQGRAPFNGIDAALAGMGDGQVSSTEIAQSMAWCYLSKDLTEKGEAARRAVLESPLARRIAPFLSESGDSAAGMAALAGMKASGWRA